MPYRKAKESAKVFISEKEQLRKLVLRTLREASEIVSSTLGPGGRNCLLESSLPGIPHTNTKDGVTVLKSLGAMDPYQHVILEQLRDSAQRTATEAGDGTTTATLLSYQIVKNLFDFCERNPKYSPQKAARRISQVVDEVLVPLLIVKLLKLQKKTNTY